MYTLIKMLKNIIIQLISVQNTKINLFVNKNMGIHENNLKNSYEATLTKWQRLWRCNSGKVQLISKRWLELWPKGTPDLIGFDSIIITPDMVGKRVAVFVGTELKATKTDKLKKKQIDWRDKILKPMGAIHREVRENGRVIESGFNAPQPRRSNLS